MRVAQPMDISRLFSDKAALQRMVQEQNTAIGLVRDPYATAEEAQELILADGVRPEDNLFSCGIIAARDEN